MTIREAVTQGYFVKYQPKTATARALLSELQAVMAERDRLRAVVNHVLALADDAYLTGHPEWNEIVAEAQAALAGKE